MTNLFLAIVTIVVGIFAIFERDKVVSCLYMVIMWLIVIVITLRQLIDVFK